MPWNRTPRPGPRVRNSMPPLEHLRHRRSSRAAADAEIRKEEEARRERGGDEWVARGTSSAGKGRAQGEWRREVCQARRLRGLGERGWCLTDVAWEGHGTHVAPCSAGRFLSPAG